MPRVGSLRDVDKDEDRPLFVGAVQFPQAVKLTAKSVSAKAAKQEHHRFLAEQIA
jgi:hypothetical protein